MSDENKYAVGSSPRKRSLLQRASEIREEAFNKSIEAANEKSVLPVVKTQNVSAAVAEAIALEDAEKSFDKLRKFYVREKPLGNNVLVFYLVKELSLYFLVAFLFFFAIFFVNQFLLLAENILRQRVPVFDVARLITYGLPFIIAQSAPFATLVGFLGCLGRLMSDNEVLIIRAAGLSFRFVMVPVLILGLIISILSFFVNDFLLPIGSIRYNELYRSILASNPTVELEPNSARRLDTAIFVVGDVEGNVMSDLVFFDTDTDGDLFVIVGNESEIREARNEGVLLYLTISDGTTLVLDSNDRHDVDVISAEEMGITVFDSALFGSRTRISPSEMTSFDLGRELRRMKNSSGESKTRINLYTLEYNKKFSLPFASLFFAILALPLAFLFGKHNGQTIGMLIGLFICVVYWAMMILGQIFASRNGFSGFWSMWLPNILIGTAGILLYFTLRRR